MWYNTRYESNREQFLFLNVITKSVSLTKESAAVFLWKKGEAMFKEGDFIIYGSNGVCQVEHI